MRIYVCSCSHELDFRIQVQLLQRKRTYSVIAVPRTFGWRRASSHEDYSKEPSALPLFARNVFNLVKESRGILNKFCLHWIFVPQLHFFFTICCECVVQIWQKHGVRIVHSFWFSYISVNFRSAFFKNHKILMRRIASDLC